MPKSIVSVSDSSPYTGSIFSLWCSLRFHALPSHLAVLAEKPLRHLALPVSASQIPTLGMRTQRLLLRRTKESIPEESIVFLHPSLSKFPEYQNLCTAPSNQFVSGLYLQFLPDILQMMHRQWGFPPEDASCCILSQSCEISALCSALAPYVRHIDAVTSSFPSYQEQNNIWETWGIPVCFRKEIPSDTHLIIIGDWADDLPQIPSSAFVLNPYPNQSVGITPNRIFFRFPGSFSHLATTLGGISLLSLAMILSAFYPISPDAESAKEAGFSVSRISRPNGKNYG